MHVKTRLVIAAVIALVPAIQAAAVVGAQDVVAIRMRGKFFSEPATVRVTIAVEPDERNRSLVIQADGDRLFRSSEVRLEGDKGQRLHNVEFKNLPAGQYVIRAEVRSTAEVRGAAEELLVVGDPGDQQ
jgi:hypothetical protein